MDKRDEGREVSQRRPSVWQRINLRRPSVKRTIMISQQLAQVAEGAAEHFRRIEVRLDQLEPRVQPVDSRLDNIERHIVGEPSLQVIREEVSRLRQAPALTGVSYRITNAMGTTALGFVETSKRPATGYAGFEDTFRGTSEFVTERLLPYVELVGRREPVVDVGCGRGEFLDLLREQGIHASGVEPDCDMASRARSRGHSVIQTDAVSALRDMADGSVAVIFMSHVIEHLDPDEFPVVMSDALRVLTGGGRLIVETPNPHCLEVLKTFWVDLTHKHPIFPEVFLDHARRAGFASGEVLFPWGCGDVDRDLTTQGAYSAIVEKATVTKPPNETDTASR